MQKELNLEKEYHPTFKEKDANKLILPIENMLSESSFSLNTKKIEFSNYTSECQIEFDIQKLNEKKNFKEENINKKRGYLILSTTNSIGINYVDWGCQLLNSSKNQLYINKLSNYNTTYLQQNSNNFKKIKNKNYSYSSLFIINYTHWFDKIKFITDIQYLFNFYKINDISQTSSFNTFQIDHCYLCKIHTNTFKKIANSLNYKFNFTYGPHQQEYKFSNKNKHNINQHIAINIDFNVSPVFINKIGIEGFFFYNIFHSSTIINPYGIYSYKHLQTRIGSKINIDCNHSTFIAPDLQINWTPNNKISLNLAMYGEIKNNYNYNTLFNAFFFENYYLKPYYILYNSKIPLDITLSTTLQVLQNVQINLFSKYQMIHNNPVFNVIEDPDLNILYINALFFKIGGYLGYTYQDIFSINIRNTYSKCKCNNSQPNIDKCNQFIWDQPYFIVNFEVSYKLHTIPLKFDLNYQYILNNRNYFNDKKERKNNIYNLLLKTTYTHNNKFSMVATIDNALLQKYNMYTSDFAEQNFNFTGGLNFKF